MGSVGVDAMPIQTRQPTDAGAQAKRTCYDVRDTGVSTCLKTQFQTQEAFGCLFPFGVVELWVVEMIVTFVHERGMPEVRHGRTLPLPYGIEYKIL